MDKFPMNQPDQQNQDSNLGHALRVAGGSILLSGIAIASVYGIAQADGGAPSLGDGHPCNTIFQPDCLPGSTNPPKTTPESSTTMIVTTSTTEGTTTTTHPNSTTSTTRPEVTTTTSTTTPEVTTTTTTTPKVTVTTGPGVTVTTVPGVATTEKPKPEDHTS